MKSIGFLLLLSLLSCKKYERDNQLYHFRSPGTRLSRNTWVNTRTYHYKKGFTITCTQGDISFAKGGRFNGSLYPFLGSDGKWDLVDKKRKVQIAYSNGQTIEYQIICLEIRINPEESILELRDDSIVHSFRAHE